MPDISGIEGLAEIHRLEKELAAAHARIRGFGNSGLKDGHADEATRLSWNDPDLALAKDDLAPPPKFDWAAVPPAWCDWLKGTAADCSAPVDFTAASLICAAGAVLGNVRRASPWPSWVVHPFLWFALVGPSSAMKTPAIIPFKTGLMVTQNNAMTGLPGQLREWEEKREAATLKLEAWKKEYKAAVAAGATAPKKPEEADAPRQPTPPRLVIVDASTEEAQMLLSRNHRGLILVRSELAAWMGQFDRYGGAGSDRGFYLEAYDGGSHTVDRIKHDGEAIQIPYCSLAILGGTQPDKLRGIFSGPDDGLAERFAYIWADTVPPSRPAVKGMQDRAGALLRAFGRLRSLQWGQAGTGAPIPKIIGFTKDGLDILDKVRVESASENRQGLLHNWRGKNPGRLLSLALVLEYLEWATKPDDTPEPEIISIEAVKRAADYIDYLDAMMVRSLGELAISEAQRHAAAIGRMIIETRAAEINERALYQSQNFRPLRDKKLRAEVFGELEIAGWTRPKKAAATGGRRSNDWEVNPQLLRVR
jgi:hypothetical protein